MLVLLYLTREHISNLITDRLRTEKEHLTTFFNKSKHGIGYFFLDDLLPDDLVLEIYKSFPKTEDTIKKNTLKEYKYIAYQMNRYPTLLEETIYAFQQSNVVEQISEICSIETLLPDASLYAGGLSLMKKNNFLKPHLDNSHDKDRNHWRVLNLLYYVTPNWEYTNGGNLELWPNGLKGEPETVTSKYNRLVVMATHQSSWHSVSKVMSDGVRCCISNYFFSNNPLMPSDSFHVTSFRGRPEEKLLDKILRLDSKVRMLLRKMFRNGVRENPHHYKK